MPTLIAAGLAPLAPGAELAAASRLFLSEIREHVERRQSFGFETTLLGRGHLRLVNRLMTGDWRVELIYLALSDVELSKQRVAERVAHGGHGVPVSVIERRFPRSLDNLFHRYAPVVHRTPCLLNTASPPMPVATWNGGSMEVHDSEILQNLLRKAET